jgi:hypothetical protein
LQLIKNTDFTDIEQLKEFKDKPSLTKNSLTETLNNARWILLVWGGQREGIY